jgi:hypothetical protein
MADTLLYRDARKWARLAASGTVINRSGRAYLHRVTVNTPIASNVCTIYNFPTAAGEVVSVIDASSGGGTYEYGFPLPSGLTVHSDGLADITVIYE